MAQHLSDYHTHTTYCDGKSTAYAMAEQAYALGFTHYGFSGHGYTDFDLSYCMTRENTALYRRDVSIIKEKYRGRMEVLLGIEQDMFSSERLADYDYIIGSAHYIDIEGRYYPIDCSMEDFQKYLHAFFDDDFDAMAAHYYHGVSDLLERVDADIIGHFDLITKYREKLGLPLSDRYYEAALATLDRLLKYDKPFEVNVGAISRGYRTSPYPDAVLLCHIAKAGGRIIITGDTHKADNLGKNLDIGLLAAKEAGFTERVILTSRGKEIIPL